MGTPSRFYSERSQNMKGRRHRNALAGKPSSTLRCGDGFDGADDVRAAALTREGQGESGPHTGFCGMGHRELTVLHQESSQMRWDTDDVTVAWVRFWENQIL